MYRTTLLVQEIYEPPIPPSPPSQLKSSLTQTLSIPPHSLVAFSLFLRLPGYAEVLLKEKRRAQCLLRLVLGVTDDGEGGTCTYLVSIVVVLLVRHCVSILSYIPSLQEVQQYTLYANTFLLIFVIVTLSQLFFFFYSFILFL